MRTARQFISAILWEVTTRALRMSVRLTSDDPRALRISADNLRIWANYIDELRGVDGLTDDLNIVRGYFPQGRDRVHG